MSDSGQRSATSRGTMLPWFQNVPSANGPYGPRISSALAVLLSFTLLSWRQPRGRPTFGKLDMSSKSPA